MFFLHWKKTPFKRKDDVGDVSEQMRKTLGVGDRQATTCNDSNDGNKQQQLNWRRQRRQRRQRQQLKKKRLNEHWALVLCYDFSVLSASPPYLQGAIVASLYLVIFNILIHIPRSNQQRRNLVMFLNFRDVHLHLSLWFTWKRFKFQISWVI